MGNSVLRSYLHQQGYCEKMDGLISGITKVIKEDICKEDLFEN